MRYDHLGSSASRLQLFRSRRHRSRDRPARTEAKANWKASYGRPPLLWRSHFARHVSIYRETIRSVPAVLDAPTPGKLVGSILSTLATCSPQHAPPIHYPFHQPIPPPIRPPMPRAIRVGVKPGQRPFLPFSDLPDRLSIHNLFRHLTRRRPRASDARVAVSSSTRALRTTRTQL